LPDLVDQLLPRVAKLAVDVPELLGFRHVHGPLDRLANGVLDLREELLEDRVDPFLPRLGGVGAGGRAGMTQLLGEGTRWTSTPPPAYRATAQIPHPSNSCSPGERRAEK
jgi:hypothetical protein